MRRTHVFLGFNRFRCIIHVIDVINIKSIKLDSLRMADEGLNASCGGLCRPRLPAELFGVYYVSSDKSVPVH